VSRDVVTLVPAYGPDARIWLGGQLAVVLGGDPNGFVGALLTAMQYADPGNNARLRDAFPAYWCALKAWQKAPVSPTLEQLADAATDVAAENFLEVEYQLAGSAVARSWISQ
jgi:hypothetical protein